MRPPLWARGGHAQTLLAYMSPAPGEALEPRSLPKGLVPESKLDSLGSGVARREVPVSDGDRVVVMDAAPMGQGPLDGVTVHLMHGLTGCTESNYMRFSAAVLRRRGARVFGFNHRGQGPGEGLAKRLYHSGSFADLWASVAAGRGLYPDSIHLAVGFSLSANTALLGITERGSGLPEGAYPDGVVAVNPPVDLRACAIRIETGFNRLYDRNFVRGLRAAVEQRKANGWLPESVTIPPGASVRGADEAVTAPLAGYASADDYYADCSSGPRLGSLTRPAVILSSRDDPFIAPEDIEEAAAGTPVVVHMEATGGHLGYLQRPTASKLLDLKLVEELPGIERRWLAGALLHYVQALKAEVG
ncbi:MAG: alpha/beta fold hydrolase [Planctomycetota bacterium]